MVRQAGETGRMRRAVRSVSDREPALVRRLLSANHTLLSENHSAVRRQHEPWNKGRLIGQKRPLKPKDVWTYGSGSNWKGGSVTWPCSTSPSTANSGL